MKRAWTVPVIVAAAALCSAEPKDVIKSYKFEVKQIPYKASPAFDPFVSLLPLKAGTAPEEWKVRIASLRLTSVILGKRKVAVFQESSGPSFSYILVSGALIGPDNKPIPGVEGSIEAIPGKREYRVILKQGVESVEFTLADERAKAAMKKASAGSGEGGGSSISSK